MKFSLPIGSKLKSHYTPLMLGSGISHVVSDNLKHDKYVVVVLVPEILKHKPEGVH